MHQRVVEAIERHYRMAVDPEALPERAVTPEEMAELVDQLRSAFPQMTVGDSRDEDYATSYEIQIHEQPLEAPRPRPIYGLVVRVSWLARVAMCFWNRYDPGRAGTFLREPETEEARSRQARVRSLLEGRDIVLLSWEELTEEIADLDVTLLDDAPHDPMHLLFAEYL